MGTLIWNLRGAARSWRRTPLLAASAVLTLALGVGAATAVYSVASGVIFNVLPWAEDPGRVFVLDTPRQMDARQGQGVSPGAYLDWRAQARSFEVLAGYAYGVANLTDGDDGGLVVQASRVTAGALEPLGLRLHAGRLFNAADGEPGAPRVVLMSHGLWERRYGADPKIVGSDIRIDGEPATVVGILQRDEFFLFPGDDLLQVLAIDPASAVRNQRPLGVLALAKPGVSIEQARSEMQVIADRLAAQYPETDSGLMMRVRPVSEAFVGGQQGRVGVLLLLAAIGFVLLIVCANVANLLLARAAGRVKEIATRSAIGGTRLQIMVQLLLESALVALIALPLSLLFGWLTLEFLIGLAPPEMGWLRRIFRFDRHVFVFATIVSLATVLIFGLAPAVQASRIDLQRALKEGGGRGSSSARPWVRQFLAIAQLGIATTLVSTATLLAQEISGMQLSDPGIDAEALLVTGVELPTARYPGPEQWQAFHGRLLDAIARVPGVELASSVSFPPFGGYLGPRVTFDVEGAPRGGQSEAPQALLSISSPGYLRSLGLRLRQGRSYDERDRASSVPVLIVNEALVRKHFPGENPLGHRLLIRDAPQLGGSPREIVGVVSDYRNRGMRDSPIPQVFVPYVQAPYSSIGLVVRAKGNPAAIATEVRTAVRQVDDKLPALGATTMSQRIRDQLWGALLVERVLFMLSAVALLLASLGVYAVISYSTSQRAQELAIRLALGAEPLALARLVLRQAAILASAGIVLAFAMSALMSPVLARLLASGSVWSGLQFGVAACALASVAILGAGVPAYRSTRVDPINALRAE